MATTLLCFYSNSTSIFSAAVLSELLRKWLYISVVVLVGAWPARPATVTSGTPAAICMVMLVWRSELRHLKFKAFVGAIHEFLGNCP